MHIKFILTFMVLFAGFASAQTNQIDSLLNIAKTTKIDSLKLNAYVKICNLCDIYDNLKYGKITESLATKLIKQSKNETDKLKFIQIKLNAYNIIRVYYQKTNNQDSVRKYHQRAIELAKSTKNPELLFEVNSQYINYISMLQNDEGLKLAYENLELSKKANNCKLISKSIGIIANVNYWNIGNTTKAFEYYELAIKEAEKCKDKDALLSTYKNCENPYFNTQQYDRYKQILLKEEKIEPKLKQDIWHIASFGDLYRNLNQFDSAELYYKDAIALAEKQKDSMSLMHLYYNYALIPENRKDYKTAIKYCEIGILIAEKLKSADIYGGYRQISNVYRRAEDWKNAKKYLILVVKEAEEYKRELSLIGYYRRMSEIEYELGNFKIAYDYLLKNIELFEKHNNAEKTSGLIKTEEINLKKQKQLEIDLANEQKEKERKVKNISFIALGVSLILICGIVFSFLKIKKANRIIISQKKEVEQQKQLIEEKQKEVLDSIHYAKRIQMALLPSDKLIEKALKKNSKK